MNPEKFGDSYDFVKREIIHGLAPADKWDIHPMFFARPQRFNFASQHARFLGISVVEGRIYHRNLVTDVGSGCLNHLFLDPDKGLTVPRRPVRHRRHAVSWNEHICVEELTAIATAEGRKHKLTLVYDQSYSRNIKLEKRMELAAEKLERIRELSGNRLYGVAYVSHVAFIWVSANPGTVVTATRRLRTKKRIPFHRLVGL